MGKPNPSCVRVSRLFLVKFSQWICSSLILYTVLTLPVSSTVINLHPHVGNTFKNNLIK